MGIILWQQCWERMTFVDGSDSWVQFVKAPRSSWRNVARLDDTKRCSDGHAALKYQLRCIERRKLHATSNRSSIRSSISSQEHTDNSRQKIKKTQLIRFTERFPWKIHQNISKEPAMWVHRVAIQRCGFNRRIHPIGPTPWVWMVSSFRKACSKSRWAAIYANMLPFLPIGKKGMDQNLDALLLTPKCQIMISDISQCYSIQYLSVCIYNIIISIIIIVS